MSDESTNGRRMDWGKLLKVEHLSAPDYPQQKHRPAYMQDIDRILFSPPFRRLANKTQVHPLYDNDHIHHRMIHSLEVTSVGRSLGMEVGAWLADECYEIEDEHVAVIAGLVQTACMAHDIGNPPFGHSGEEAIASWFKRKFSCPTGILQDITKQERHEFEAFEGNAQGFRILTRTEMYKNDGGLRLTLGSLGTFTKYPVTAYIGAHVGNEGIVNGKKYAGLKKYGFFQNDVVTFEQIADKLGLPKDVVKDNGGGIIGHWWRRHPLSLLVEAADDICYNIMDLEDAYLSGDLQFDLVNSSLEALARNSNKEYSNYGEIETISRRRALAIRGTIAACVDSFKCNYDDIMNGNFAGSLIEVSDKSAEFSIIRKIAKEKIFTATRKTELEVYGRNVVYRVLDGLLPLIDELRLNEWDPAKLSSYHAQVARALKFPTDTLAGSYDALHSLTDFVSGMTDRYAVKVADMIGK